MRLPDSARLNFQRWLHCEARIRMLRAAVRGIKNPAPHVEEAMRIVLSELVQASHAASRDVLLTAFSLPEDERVRMGAALLERAYGDGMTLDRLLPDGEDRRSEEDALREEIRAALSTMSGQTVKMP